MKTKSPCITYVQYSGGFSVRRRHVISKMEDIQYKCVTTSVWKMHIISMVGGYAVWTSHIVNTEEDMQYRTTKTAQEVVGGCIYLGKMIF